VSADVTPAARRVLTILALVVTTLLALTLWWLAVRELVTIAGLPPGTTRTVGTVISCADAPIGPGCTVRYSLDGGVPTTRPIDLPGLVGVVEGDVVPLVVDTEGMVRLGGWRPWADAVVLAALAVATSLNATRWLRTVLADSDRRALVHGVDLTLVPDVRARRRADRDLRDAV